MTIAIIALLALTWTGFSLGVLAMLFRKLGTPRQAAWRAFGVGLAVNTVSAWYAALGAPLSAVLLIIACHVVLLPFLLMAAKREHVP